MGKEGVGTMNESGEMLTDFCEQSDLVIAGTVFPYRRIHKVTWISRDAQSENRQTTSPCAEGGEEPCNMSERTEVLTLDQNKLW